MSRSIFSGSCYGLIDTAWWSWPRSVLFWLPELPFDKDSLMGDHVTSSFETGVLCLVSSSFIIAKYWSYVYPPSFLRLWHQTTTLFPSSRFQRELSVVTATNIQLQHPWICACVVLYIFHASINLNYRFTQHVGTGPVSHLDWCWCQHRFLSTYQLWCWCLITVWHFQVK